MRTLAERAEANAKKGILTVEQVLRIRRSLAKGESPADLAILYSVSEQTITRIRDRKTWAWLGEEEDRYLASPHIGEAEELGAKASLEKLNKLMATTKASDKLVDELERGQE